MTQQAIEALVDLINLAYSNSKTVSEQDKVHDLEVIIRQSLKRAEMVDEFLNRMEALLKMPHSYSVIKEEIEMGIKKYKDAMK